MSSDDQPRSRRWHRARSALLNAALVVVVFLVVSTFQSRDMLAVDGEDAPALRGTTLAGNAYDLADVRGTPVLIYFFAPWCKICAASADNLVRLRRWQDTADLKIVAVALDWDTADDVHAYADRHELNVPVVLGDVDVARRWQVRGFPSYYVLDSGHRVARRDIGYTSQLGLWWRARTVN